MARRSPDPAKEQLWRRLLAEWRSSGQSVRAFCRSRALSEPSFYFWRQTLIQRDQTQPPAPFVPAGNPPVTSAGESRPAPLFAPVRLVGALPVPPTAPQAASCLEVLCRGGRIVRVPAGFDPATVRALVVALEELPC